MDVPHSHPAFRYFDVTYDTSYSKQPQRNHSYDGDHMNGLKMATSGKYQITIQGYLDASWSERLGGLRIVTTEMADGQEVITLTGEVVDQAALWAC